MRGETGGEAQKAEDDVLDPRLHVGLAPRLDLVGRLAGERQQHGNVVRAQAPQRVLLLAQYAEVEPIGVDVADLAELARVGDLLQPQHARVVLEQVADHQHALGGARRLDGTLGVGDPLGQRLLDEAVLARLQHPGGEVGMGGNGRGQRDRVEPRIGQKVVEVGGRPARRAATEPGARAPPQRRRTASSVRCRGRCRSYAPGSGPSSRGPPRPPGRARRSQPHQAGRLDPPGHAAQVHDQRRVAHDALRGRGRDARSRSRRDRRRRAPRRGRCCSGRTPAARARAGRGRRHRRRAPAGARGS